MVPADGVRLPHRIVHLPMAFNEKWTHEAISRCADQQRPPLPEQLNMPPLRVAHCCITRLLSWQSCLRSNSRVGLQATYLPPCHLPPHVLCRYMRSVRPEAPYLPSNVKFIAGESCAAGIDEERCRCVPQTCGVTTASSVVGSISGLPGPPWHAMSFALLAPLPPAISQQRTGGRPG